MATLTFKEALHAVQDGLRSGTIPHLKREVRCLNPATDNHPVKNKKRWTTFVRPAGTYSVNPVAEQLVYVSEDGDMAVLMRSHAFHDDVRSFLPTGGDEYTLALQSILPSTG